MTHRVSDMNWETFRDQVPSKIDLVLIPVGTVEAHGAIPLGTDTIIPTSLAEKLAPRLHGLIAPPVPYGVTNSLLPYPGSTTVSSSTFKAYLFEAAAGLVDAGFHRVVLLNGHGGQTSEVAEVVARLWNEKRAYAVAVEWWGFVREISPDVYGDHTSGHAGVEETAMVLAVAPDLIDEKRARIIRRASRHPGMRARPFPASIILDKAEQNGDGAPDLDRKKAKAFFDRTVDAVAEGLEGVFAGWRDIR